MYLRSRLAVFCRTFDHHISKSCKTLSTTIPVLQEAYKRNEGNILRSPYGDLQIPDVSFSEFILPYFERHGQKTFMIDGVSGQSYSFHECLRSILKVSAALKKLGLRKGDVVAICSSNRPEFVIAWFAALSLGAVITEANHSFTAGELRLHLSQTGAKVLFFGEEIVEVAREAKRSLANLKKCVVFGEAQGFIPFEQLLNTDEPISSNLIGVEPTTTAQIPFSSGTSGLPKGVLLSHRSIIGSTLSTTHEGVCLHDDNDVSLLLLPMFHTFAAIYIRCSIVTGCPTVILPRFTPESLLSSIQKYRVTAFPLVPPLVLFLTQSPLVKKYDLSSLKKISCGAAPVATEHFQSLAEKLKLRQLRQGYGLTELCPITMSPKSKAVHELLDSVGCPALGVDLKIVEPESGRTLPFGQTGEILAKAEFAMTGYLKNPKATEETIDKDGWLHTGDIGFLNDRGNLYVVDRIKELIKYKGHQVAPAELESLLLQHTAVKDAAVIGVPDEKAGEVPRAFIVLESTAKNICENDIEKFVADRTVDKNKLRGGVVFVQIIPKSPSGKILRKNLREQ